MTGSCLSNLALVRQQFGYRRLLVVFGFYLRLWYLNFSIRLVDEAGLG